MSVVCSSCGFHNSDDSISCQECKIPLTSHCSHCGKRSWVGSIYCDHCAAPLSEIENKKETPAVALSSQDSAEVLLTLRDLMPKSLTDRVRTSAKEAAGLRREVTVLCIGFSRQNDQNSIVDTENHYLAINEALEYIAELIYEFEGHVDKLLENQLTALFGLPVTHENDPERAVRAALAIQQRLAPFFVQLSEQKNIHLHLHMGIHTGNVIAGNIGTDFNMNYTVVADTMTLATQLHEQASPGVVLVSNSTYQRTRPIFHYESLQLAPIKVSDETTTVYRLIRLRRIAGQVRGLPEMNVAMVGRSHHVQQLYKVLDSVLEENQARAVLVSGDAGVGKSRLTVEFRQSIMKGDSELGYFKGGCLAYARPRPYWIVADLIRNIIKVTENDSADFQLGSLQKHVEEIGLPNRTDFLPYLVHVLGLTSMQPDIEEKLRIFDADMLKNLTHNAVRQLLLHEAKSKPLVLFLDDLHWLDDASLSLIKHLVQTMVEANILFVFVSRDHDTNTIHDLAKASSAIGGLEMVNLRNLNNSENRQLVDQLIRSGSEKVEDLKQQIVNRAEGNPFYTEEIIRRLLDEGGLYKDQDQYYTTPRARKLMEDVPGTLKGIILARVDKLEYESKLVLQQACVLGGTFRNALLYGINDKPKSEIDRHLDVLVQRQLIVPTSKVKGQYEIKHNLIRDAVYSSLLKRQRQRLHDQVANTIESQQLFPPNELAELMAHHLGLGSKPIKAVPYLITAAENASRRYANETALTYYYQLKEYVEGEPDSKDKENNLIQVRTGIGRSLKLLGRYEEAKNILSENADILFQGDIRWTKDDPPSELLNGLWELADVQQREGNYADAANNLEAGIELSKDLDSKNRRSHYLTMLERLAFVRFRQGQLDEALKLAHEAISDLSLEKPNQPVTTAHLLNTLGGITWQLGNISEARGYVEKSLNLYEQLGYIWGIAQAYSNLGVLNAELGNWSKTIENWESSLELRRGTGDVLGQATAQCNIGQLRLMMGDLEGANEQLSRSLKLFQKLGDSWGAGQAYVNLAMLALVEEKIGKAEEFARLANDLANSVEGQLLQIQSRGILAQVLEKQGRHSQSINTANEALQLAKTAGLMEAEAESLRIMGTLLTTHSSFVEAETTLKQSVELSNQLNNPYSLGMSLLSLGDLYYTRALETDQKKADWLAQAVETLAQAKDILESLGAKNALEQTYRLLDQSTELLETERKATLRQTTWTPTEAAPTSFEGQRYKATILWLLLNMPLDADEELLFESMAFLLPACAAIAQEHGGFVKQRNDGLTIVFGAPIALEDAPDQAINTAYHLVQYLTHEMDADDTPISFQMGISLGDVVAGYSGIGGRGEFIIQGEPIDEAKHIANLSRVGKVWVNDGVHRITRRLAQYRQAPSERKKGRGLFELMHLRGDPGPARGIPGRQARFIGREPFLQAMEQISDNLDKDLGGIIWVEGEAGIGKSRLMNEFIRQMPGEGQLIWRAGCSAQQSRQAFSLIADLVADIFQLRPNDNLEQIKNKIDEAVIVWPQDAWSSRPYLELLIGLPPSGVEGERLAQLEPDQLRQQIFVAFRRILKTLTKQSPLVLVLDDLHWIDPISAELLIFVSTIVASDPVLFVCAQRREGADSPNDRLVRLQSLMPGQTTNIFLDRLSFEESESLVDELMPNADLPTEVKNGIISRSEGNPYFIEEFVRMILEQGYIQIDDDGCQIDPTLDLSKIPIPTSLESLIRSRVDALPGELKHTLQYASIIGRRFRKDLLAEFTGSIDLGRTLDRLASRVILRPVQGGEYWEFSHHLIESVVYESLLLKNRKQLHRKYADCLEKYLDGKRNDFAETLAHHLINSGDEERALPYLVIAGEKAVAQNASDEALVLLQRAANILEKQPLEDESLRWQIAIGLGDVYRFVGKYVESSSVLKSGLPLAESGRLFRPHRAGLYRRLGETAHSQGEYDEARKYFEMTQLVLGESKQPQHKLEIARTFTGLAWVYFAQGRFDDARKACEESKNYASAVDGLGELAAADNLLGGIYYHLGEWHKALHHTTRAMVLREQMGYSWGVAATLSNLGILSFSAGRWNKSLNFFNRSLNLRQEMGDVEGVAITNNNLGMVYREQGELEMAKVHFLNSLETASLFNIAYHIANAYAGITSVLLLEGDLVAAEDSLTSGLGQAESINALDIVAELTRIQAEILLRSEDVEAALEVAQNAVSLSAEIGNRSQESTAWRLCSECARRRGDLYKAMDNLDKAKDALSEVKDDLENGRIALQASRNLMSAGQVEEAMVELNNAKQLFTSLGANLYLRDIELIEA